MEGNPVSNYDIYLRSIEQIRQSMSLPIVAMTREEFVRAQIESDFVHRSVIDMDAFETAFHR
jgi:hypothetical protein